MEISDTTLLLNASFEPLRVVDWRRAFGLVFQEKVEILEEYRTMVRTVRQQFRVPAVIKLTKWVNLKRRLPVIRFSRSNIYLRDNHTCQYCRKVFAETKLTLDHLVPVVRGGKKNWENIVTACMPCNQRKGDRSPKEVGFELLSIPKAPKYLPGRLESLHRKQMHELWEPYLLSFKS